MTWDSVGANDSLLLEVGHDVHLLFELIDPVGVGDTVQKQQVDVSLRPGLEYVAPSGLFQQAHCPWFCLSAVW